MALSQVVAPGDEYKRMERQEKILKTLGETTFHPFRREQASVTDTVTVTQLGGGLTDFDRCRQIIDRLPAQPLTDNDGFIAGQIQHG